MRTLILLFALAAIPSIASARAKCADFSTQAQAQRYFEAHKPGWKRLDGDKDGEACECLPGGSSYDKSSCKRWRRKYGK